MTGRLLRLVAAETRPDDVAVVLSRAFPDRAVTSVSDLEEALSTLESTAVDGVVVGHAEPGLDAVAAIERIRDRCPSLPIVVFPTEGSERLASDALGVGATDYVRRADGHETLVERLERALESTSTRLDGDCYEILDALDDAIAVYDPADGSVVDVTERKRRLQRLRSFRQAVEQAGHSIYITDPDGTIQYVNPAFEDVSGYSAAEAIGETPRLLKSGVHDRAFYAELWGTILEGGVWENQIVNRHKSGAEYVVNQTIAPITDEDGEIVNFVAVNADITRQKRRESQLRRLHEAVGEWLEATSREQVAIQTTTHLEELLDIELNGVFLYDETSEWLRPAALSDPAVDLFETVPRFSPGDGIAWRVFERGEAAIYDDVREAPDVYDAETPIRSEIVLPIGDHGVLLVGSETTAAFDETDVMLVRIVASSLEATFDRIGRERELERQKERFEEFASVVSHDLRNPLTVAMGELERARETGDEESFAAVVQAHERMATIIDDLLWLAREGREIDDPRPVSLADVAATAWENVDPQGASLELACDRRVLADPGRLQQLFENLFRNSVEHGSTTPDSHTRRNAVEHGSSSTSTQQPTAETTAADELTVRVGVTDDGFYVADTGVGIPESERERVLETGYSTADGTGLGLSIVTTIVDSHGWELEITDSEEGGARFEIASEFVDGR
ncbi:PAS domain S-box protein [Natronolimnohabitans sp. A-GB9]|uniref:hybrid sensor histidine kinase/response regulator n=1 Tax=Natronolimnohabitans sp. A-GB9 TaxID=3069757 RepID=UPI0027B75C9D|nr:PAS domain S-box protein [Natronolimnohabitans sp. A-GB9]MDQ2050705.1 PAS domain S-box protein [Natronolimnohabitans sp. A-GB9]